MKTTYIVDQIQKKHFLKVLSSLLLQFPYFTHENTNMRRKQESLTCNFWVKNLFQVKMDTTSRFSIKSCLRIPNFIYFEHFFEFCAFWRSLIYTSCERGLKLILKSDSEGLITYFYLFSAPNKLFQLRKKLFAYKNAKFRPEIQEFLKN